MRILALATDAFGGYGGIAQYNRDLFTALALSERVTSIVAIPRLASHDIPPMPNKVRQLEARSGRAAYAMYAMRMAKELGPFDVVFSGHIYHTPLALMIGRWLKIPVWLQTHGIDAWERPRHFLRYAVEQSALITTVSRFTKRKLLAWAKIEPEHVRVLSNTVRPMFTAGKKDGAFLSQIGLANRKIILTVSRLSKSDYYKGHRRIINVLPKVLCQYPDAIYVVVGDGDDRSDLEQDVAHAGLSASVRFAGRRSDEDVLQLYRAATAFVMPSTKEGFGIVFAEAAATGLPVIGGNQDGSADALADGVIGTMIDPEDEGQLSDAIAEALSKATRTDAWAVQRFAFDNFARHVDELVRSIAR